MRRRATKNLSLAVVLMAAWLPFSARLAVAAVAPDDLAFTNACKLAEGKWWDLAEKEFADFVRAYSNSTHRADAILRQAQARYYQMTNSAGAVGLLSSNLDQAGPLTGEYEFWLGEAQFQGSNYLAAATAYAALAREPTSPRRLEAAYNQAVAFSRLGDWQEVVALLDAADAPLASALRSGLASPFAIDGALLLADAQLKLRHYGAAEGALQTLAPLELPSRSQWLRQYLLCQTQMGEGRLQAAMDGADQLETLATASGQPDAQAETSELKAGILHRLGRPNEAIVEYEKTLTASLPPERRRQVVLQIVQLQIDQGRIADASQRLDQFLSQDPRDASSAGVLLALGELNLLRWEASASTQPTEAATAGMPARGTNLLETALAQLSAVLTNGDRHPLFGRAQLDRGWCLWLAKRRAESQSAFEAATLALPPSEDRTIARFKWADAQYQQQDFRGALTNYSSVVEEATSLPALRARLLEPALYLQLRAADAVGDERSANAALAKILERYPDSYDCPSELLLHGQSLDRSGKPAEARGFLFEFEQRFPQSPLLPQARLLIAHTYESQRDWPAALAVYDAWVTNFTSNTNMPRAQYCRGWANYQADRETNALSIFTNLVAQFPTNEFAPLAQFWVGDIYFRLNKLEDAEKNYQLVFQNKQWAATDLAYRARLMAGRAAVMRLSYTQAINYFTTNINDKACPPQIDAQSWFERGDATVSMGSMDTNKPLGNFVEAIGVFRQLRQQHPTNQLAVLAEGRIGDCYFQLGQLDSTNYDAAAQAYSNVMTQARAGISARSGAEVGLALALEKQVAGKPAAEQTPMRKLALEHLLNVVYERNRFEGETADRLWVERAGLEAGSLAEEMQLWEQAAELYENYLIPLLPPLRPTLEKRLKTAREHLARPL